MHTIADIPVLCTTNGLCTLCKKRAEWLCQRCLDFYCSPECQRKDWQRHRYICFAMPGLQPAVHFDIESSGMCKHQSPSAKQLDNLVGNSKKEFLTAVQPNDIKKSEIETQKVPNTQKSPQTVILLGFISSNVCIVRPIGDSDAHMMAMKKIDTLGRRAQLLNNCPSTGSVALSLLNGVMSRVEILSAQDERRIKVVFYDYGMIATVDICDLRVASDDILNMPRFSKTVNLRNVSKASLDESRSFLKKFEGIECEMRNYSKSNGDIEVDLISLSGKTQINEEIEKYYSNMSSTKASQFKNDIVTGKQLEINENITVSGTKDELLVDLSHDASFRSGVQTILKPLPSKCMPDNEPKPILTPPFDIYIFKPEMTNFKVVVLDTSALGYGYIGCIAEGDLKYLVNIQEYLAKYKDKENVYSPKLHEYCLARFENEWYRARVVKVIDQTRYAVVYLDFTNESILTPQDIRRYPDDLNGPCRTNLCLIDGLPKSLKPDHIQFLKKEITTESKLLIDRVKEVVQQIVVIQCNNIIKKMSANGLI